jgi:hypothetical protein
MDIYQYKPNVAAPVPQSFNPTSWLMMEQYSGRRVFWDGLGKLSDSFAGLFVVYLIF